MLAKALVELEAQYPTQIDPRVLAWVNLVGVAGMIYGTRVFAYRMRKENEREEKRRYSEKTPPTSVADLVQPKSGGISNVEQYPFQASKN